MVDLLVKLLMRSIEYKSYEDFFNKIEVLDVTHNRSRSCLTQEPTHNRSRSQLTQEPNIGFLENQDS